MKKLTAYQFEKTFQSLGIDLDSLGCVILDLKPLKNMKPALVKEIKSSLYYSKNKDRFWINGWVFNIRPHLTLLYGLLNTQKKCKPHIAKVLQGWESESLTIEKISYFNSPHKDEDYYCLVAKIKKTNNLLEGYKRLEFLPHVNIFSDYTPHVTICYLDKKIGAKNRDALMIKLDKLWQGKEFQVKGISF